MLIPASVYSCSSYSEASATLLKESEGTRLRIRGYGSPGAASTDTLDILTFCDDALMRLDSYTRLEGADPDSLRIASQAGEKIIFICANSQRNRIEWAGIDSYHSLGETYVHIEKERKDFPFMKAECSIRAGHGPDEEIGMTSFVSEILLRSIRCDFSGKAYHGKHVEDPKVYLININAQVSMSNNGPWLPERIVNHGHLDYDDMSGFTEPDIVFREMKEDITSDISYPDIRLLCYPNTCTQEGPGSPFTKLVIEGSIDTVKYYWSIPINRFPWGEGGVLPHCRYTYDIVLKRKGTDNPDIPTVTEETGISFGILKWKEKEEYGIAY